MSSTRVNRHLANQAKLKIAREFREELAPYRITIDLEDESVTQEFQSDVLKQFFDKQKQELDYFLSPITVTNEEVDSLISGIQEKWDDEQIKLLVDSSKKSILQSIVVPFGLGHVVAGYDKRGGNVTTLHNAENGVFANNQDERNFNVEYKPTDYRGKRFNDKNERLKKQAVVVDAYTGKEYPKKYKDEQKLQQEKSEYHLDHVIPAKQIHDNGWLRLSTTIEERNKIATDETNLVPTNNSLNQSKSDIDLKEWRKKLHRDTGKTNNERFEIDNNRADRVYSSANRNYKIQSALAIGKDLGNKVMQTGSLEAGKMGLQQSIGLLLTEFFAATFDEISDSYKNGFKDSLKSQSFFEALKLRLSRISERVASRWKDALSAFKEGAISGFLSNLVTMLINTLVTTGRRIVRLIREGVFSIMDALKMAMFPPQGMTRAEASDAALKLLATGVAVSLGILAEEAIEKFFTTYLPQLAPTVSAIFVGAMTGIASSLLVYGLDQLDIFGVNNQRKHEFVLLELDKLIAESDKNFDSMYENEMNRTDKLVQLQSV